VGKGAAMVKDKLTSKSDEPKVVLPPGVER
jgi:hypothetical protein